MPDNNSTASIHTALALHVARFCDADAKFNPSTVSQGLERVHSSHPSLKGALIATFNATHSSNRLCPFSTSASFKPDEKTGYAKFLHLGTTRIWCADGAIDEARWNSLVEFAAIEKEGESEKIIPISKLKEYLNKCLAQDPVEPNSHRNDAGLFSSRSIQSKAASAAWDEVYDRLACGQIEMPGSAGKPESYIRLTIMRQFFEDTDKAFQLAESGSLPVLGR